MVLQTFALLGFICGFFQPTQDPLLLRVQLNPGMNWQQQINHQFNIDRDSLQQSRGLQFNFNLIFDMAVKQVSANQIANVAFSVSQALQISAGLPLDLTSQLPEAAKSGTLSISHLGGTSISGLPEGSSTQNKLLIHLIRESFDNSYVPTFPQKPIKVGESWQTRHHMANEFFEAQFDMIVNTENYFAGVTTRDNASCYLIHIKGTGKGVMNQGQSGQVELSFEGKRWLDMNTGLDLWREQTSSVKLLLYLEEHDREIELSSKSLVRRLHSEAAN